MQNDVSGLIKSALIKYVKSHNEYDGKIMEIFNNIDEAINAGQSLPLDIQNDLKNIILGALVTNGILKI